MIEIRTATVADTAGVLELWRTAGSVATVTDDQDAVRVLMVRDPEALLVAEENGHIVGTVIGGWNGWRGEVDRLAVAPTHRRQGLGTRLLDAAMSSLHDRGARRVACIVVADDGDARGFWDASRFGAQQNRVRYVDPPDRPKPSPRGKSRQ